MTFTLTSPDFAAGAPIPRAFTCEGADHSYALAWHDAPAGTRSFALDLHDPDAPDPANPRPGGWTHWVLLNIPADTTEVREGETPRGARDGPAGLPRPLPAHRHAELVGRSAKHGR